MSLLIGRFRVSSARHGHFSYALPRLFQHGIFRKLDYENAVEFIPFTRETTGYRKIVTNMIKKWSGGESRAILLLREVQRVSTSVLFHDVTYPDLPSLWVPHQKHGLHRVLLH